MQPLTIVSGRAIPLDRADVDTDQIIPARYLKRTDREGLGQFAFEAWRARPDFVLNDPRYAGASILLAGRNFGCGSSREHAPWALADMGIRVIVASSFADIFRNNCAKVGLLTIELPAAEVASLMQHAAGRADQPIKVDLPAQTIQAGEGRPLSFDVDIFVKHCLVEGLDSIGLSLAHADAIGAYERARTDTLPNTKASP
jgi:3-isopropylmalate/(R)-2-methylmalate dehydratase small subunit